MPEEPEPCGYRLIALQNSLFWFQILAVTIKVDVIEISVAIGDEVEEGDTLVVLESDKATMDVPSSHSAVQWLKFSLPRATN